jgi:dihydrodipicolinate synthase/N-acetylneuraminate lyase
MESEARPPEGLICPLVTPLDNDRKLDLRSFKRLWNYVERWVDAIVIGDPLWGEGLFLPQDLRLALIEFAIELIRGRRPLMICITCSSFKGTVLFREQAESIINQMNYKGQLYWVDFPLFYHSNRGLPQVYETMLSKSEIPLILGNNAELIRMKKRPGKHKNIRTRVLKKIAHNASVKGIIYAGDLKRALNYHMAVRFREHFVFYDGDENVFIKNPAKGGVMAGGANVFPQKWSDVTQMSLDLPPRQNAFEPARSAIWEDSRMLQRFYRLYTLLPAVAIKKILHQVGIIAYDECVWPLASRQQRDLDHTWQIDLNRLLAAYDLL